MKYFMLSINEAIEVENRQMQTLHCREVEPNEFGEIF